MNRKGKTIIKAVILAEVILLILLGLLFVRQKGENDSLRQQISNTEEQTDGARQAAEEAQAEADDASDDVSEAAGNEENENTDSAESQMSGGEAEAAGEGSQTSEETAAEQEARALLDQMTVEEKVAQLFYITPDALSGVTGTTQAGEILRQAYEEYPVGGLVFFSNNLVSEDQLREMTSALKELGEGRVGAAPFLGVDEEGGTVTRIAGTEGFPVEDVGDMSLIGATGDPARAEEVGVTLGAYLSSYGFTMDFAPDADVLVNPDNTVVKSRSFGSDPELTARMTAAETEGLQSQGVLAVLKHFPGHGATSEDSHEGFAWSNRTLEELRQCEFLPFQAGIEAGARVVMVGHISLPQVTGDDQPASLSETVMQDLLRQELGFDGIIITDAMNMGAISENYGSGEAAVQSVLAGADMILMPADFHSAYQAVLDAVNSGRISGERLDESVLRILTVKTEEW